jgi:hypothetical protein
MSDDQERAAELLSAANAQVDAPARLHAQVAALRAEAAARRRRRFRLAGATSLAAAAAAAALVIVVLPDGAATPTIEQVAALQSRDAGSPAPPRTRALLAVSAEGLPFPNWGPALGWRATGVRRGELGDRRVTTVRYVKDGRSVEYSIVSGSPLDEHGARLVRDGLQIHAAAGLVTWRRGGRTCVLSGDGVPRATLAKLAAWDGGGAVPA